MKKILEEVVEVAKKKDQEGESDNKGKEKIEEEDIIHELDPPIYEYRFLKSIKALVGKYLEGIHFFSGNMDTKLVMELIEGMEI